MTHVCPGIPISVLYSSLSSSCVLASICSMCHHDGDQESALPQLEELHACKNRLHRITGDSEDSDAPVPGFSRLNLLNISDNVFEDWQEIVKLGRLPSLRSLFLSNNQLTTLSPHGSEATGASAVVAVGGAGGASVGVDALFPVLDTLSIAGVCFPFPSRCNFLTV